MLFKQDYTMTEKDLCIILLTQGYDEVLDDYDCLSQVLFGLNYHNDSYKRVSFSEADLETAAKDFEYYKKLAESTNDADIIETKERFLAIIAIKQALHDYVKQNKLNITSVLLDVSW